MCGIAGIWGRSDARLVRTMMDRLAHRGPDAEGIYSEPGDAGMLGHRRLSIVDPAGGDQPILAGEPPRAIVANGEIYNSPRLREELEARHQFLTRSDSECALHLYHERGPEAAAGLDGMFAFAIAAGDHLYAARDAIGIKPLYFGRRDGALVFSSELKAMEGIAGDVREFPPGTWYHSGLGFHRYYQVPESAPAELPLAEHLRSLRLTLERAVVKRLMSDVPVGAFLSGGLDSSLIAALARRHLPELRTFSVGVAGSRDLLAARRVADHIGSIHHEYVYDAEEVRRRLPEIIHSLESFDQDLVRSAIPCYFASRLAAERVKVILTGEGADELFAGYDYYKGIADPGVLHRELQRSVRSLHNMNLQRVDRLTMAHSIEGRVPFLDVDMIALAQTVPPRLKLAVGGGGGPVEKWILRKACEDLLPPEIAWRDKEQFDEGSGTVDLIGGLWRHWLPANHAVAYARRHARARLRSAEECAYHKILCDGYDDAPVILDNVARWSHRPPGIGGAPGAC
jgi:asparagine synthase (glutamine-hydrolysing)